LPDRHTELLEVATELFKQHSSEALLEFLIVRVRRSLAATFAVVLDSDASQIVVCDGVSPDPDQLSAMALQAMSPPPYPAEADGGVATAYMIRADLTLIVGRSDPALRDRERQWISIMAEIADHGWQDRAYR
jgi:hypothetical protein